MFLIYFVGKKLLIYSPKKKLCGYLKNIMRIIVL